jgi:RNA polymerase sigma-70 factor (ECF subfamily)
MSENEREKEFLDLIDEHQNIIHKICLLYCRSISDKDDLYQEILLQLWRSYPSFGRKSAFSTWMYRVALNTAISMTKKFWFFNYTENLPDISVENESLLDLSEEVKLLYKAISRLAKVEKAIIFLWLEEKSYEEIAGTIGITVKNVSVKLVRIKMKLSEIIKNIQ